MPRTRAAAAAQAGGTKKTSQSKPTGKRISNAFSEQAKSATQINPRQNKSEPRNPLRKLQRKRRRSTPLTWNSWKCHPKSSMSAANSKWTASLHQSLLNVTIASRLVFWEDLYPEFLPLLESNKDYNYRIDNKGQRYDRINKLQPLVSKVRIALPPLVHLIRKDSSNNNPAAQSTRPRDIFPTDQNSDIKVEQPFPSTSELLTWPMIKDIVDGDVPLEEVETRFNNIRDEFDRAVVEWRDNIERDLVTIWNTGREDEDDTETSTSKGKEKGKSDARMARPNTRNARVSTGTSGSTSSSNSTQLVLPEFIATHTMPDGTTTTNISDLSSNLQLLLRADTMFTNDGFILRHTYPAIVPRAVQLARVIGGPEELNYGSRWNSTKLRRDDESSAIAKELLSRVGRSGATSIEMEALGGNFRCMRCNRTLTDTWENLVMHFGKEQTQYRQGQEKIQAEPGRGFIYNNTHGLGPEDTRPFAEFVTPHEAADYAFEASMQPSPMMRCMKCEEMGIDSRYFNTTIPGYENPIIEHLRDVHGVPKTKVRAGVHYRAWAGGF
ncbi:hypothetical protein AG1IA_03759 [Rhizoctonia solani AG-1 IA]|uniref:Uncharacterized protein n=1 Tax=Thanatephorus cucumeris (strain AG1-IA) TaxID=983506 RepID=L8WZG6_THACA|nr:hypothetical protein AG1IA_03759 [Rhizoctonia solani AG-1 IA]